MIAEMERLILKADPSKPTTSPAPHSTKTRTSTTPSPRPTGGDSSLLNKPTSTTTTTTGTTGTTNNTNMSTPLKSSVRPSGLKQPSTLSKLTSKVKSVMSSSANQTTATTTGSGKDNNKDANINNNNNNKDISNQSNYVRFSENNNQINEITTSDVQLTMNSEDTHNNNNGSSSTGIDNNNLMTPGLIRNPSGSSGNSDTTTAAAAAGGQHGSGGQVLATVSQMLSMLKVQLTRAPANSTKSTARKIDPNSSIVQDGKNI